MNRVTRCAAACIAFALIGPVSQIRAERVRGPVVAVASIAAPETVEVLLSARDIGVIRLESDPRILTGVQIAVRLSPALERYANAFLLYLYSGIHPDPSPARMEYTASNAAYVRIEPDVADRFLIPFTSHEGEALGGVQIIDGVSFGDSPILFVVEPISKALPDSLASEQIYLSIDGVFADAGVLELAVEPSTPPPFVLQIDRTEMDYDSAGYVLKPGMHQLRVTAEPDFVFEKNVLIDRGRIERTTIVFASTATTVRIEAPEDAVVFLDGQRYRPVVHRSVEIAPGEHVVLIQLGDYAISRRFLVTEGKEYTVSLFLDIVIEEGR